MGPNTGPVADYVDAVFGNMANMAYGAQDMLGNVQGMSAADIAADRGDIAGMVGADIAAEEADLAAEE